VSAVLSISVLSHEDRWPTAFGRALATETLDLAVRVYSVVLEDSHLDRLALVLDLLGSSVVLLFTLLGHTTTKTENQVKGRLLLDVVIRKGAAIFKLLSSEDETLLVWGDTFFVLDLGLDVVDGVGGLDLKGDGLARKGLYEDLHSSSESKHQMESRFLLNVVIG